MPDYLTFDPQEYKRFLAINKPDSGEKIKLPTKSSDELNIIANFVKKNETIGGKLNRKPYRVGDKGNWTIGIGHEIENQNRIPNEWTDEHINNQFKKDLTEKIATTKRLFKSYDDYPIDVKKSLVDGTFRGEFKKEHKTVKYINEGKWDLVPDEYIDRDDYRESIAEGSKTAGVATRMDEKADIFKQYGESLKEDLIKDLAGETTDRDSTSRERTPIEFNIDDYNKAKESFNLEDFESFKTEATEIEQLPPQEQEQYGFLKQRKSTADKTDPRNWSYEEVKDAFSKLPPESGVAEEAHRVDLLRQKKEATGLDELIVGEKILRYIEPGIYKDIGLESMKISEDAEWEDRIGGQIEDIMTKLDTPHMTPTKERQLSKAGWAVVAPIYEILVQTPQNIIVPLAKGEGAMGAFKAVVGQERDRSVTEFLSPIWRADHPVLTKIMSIGLNLGATFGISKALTKVSADRSLEKSVTNYIENKIVKMRQGVPKKLNLTQEVDKVVARIIKQNPALKSEEFVIRSNILGKLSKIIGKENLRGGMTQEVYNQYFKPGALEKFVFPEGVTKIAPETVKFMGKTGSAINFSGEILESANKVLSKIPGALIPTKVITQIAEAFNIPQEEITQEKAAELIIKQEDKILKPQPLLSKFLQKDDRKLTTLQGDYTNGHWLLKPEFTPDKLKEKIGKGEETHPDTTEVWARNKKIQPVGDIVGYDSEAEDPTYIVKADDGREIGVAKRYYDYLKKNIPNFNLKVNDTDMFTVYSGNKEAGLLMPIRASGGVNYVKTPIAEPAPEVKPVIPKAEQPLSQQAKGKSLDEFVESQGKMFEDKLIKLGVYESAKGDPFSFSEFKPKSYVVGDFTDVLTPKIAEILKPIEGMKVSIERGDKPFIAAYSLTFDHIALNKWAIQELSPAKIENALIHESLHALRVKKGRIKSTIGKSISKEYEDIQEKAAEGGVEKIQKLKEQELTSIWEKAQEPPIKPPIEKPVAKGAEEQPKKPDTTYAKGVKVGLKRARTNIYKKLKSSKTNIIEIRKDLTDYIKKLELKDKGRMITMVRDVHTKKGLTKALLRVDSILEKRSRGDAINTLKNTIGKIDTKKLRPEYQKEIKSLMDIDLVNRRESTIRTLSNTKKYLEEHPDNNMPQKELNRLDILSRKKVGDLTTEDIKLLENSISHLVKLHDLKNSMIFGRKYVEAKDVATQANSNLARAKKIRKDPDAISTRVKSPKAVGRVKKIATTESYNAELITQILDKEDGGIIQKVFYDGIDDGRTKELKFLHQADDYFKEKIPFNISKWSEHFTPKPSKLTVDYQKIKLSSGKTVTITKAEKIALYLHSLNDKNLAHLIEGGFSFAKRPSKINKISVEDLAELTKLTPNEQQVADAMYEHYNSIQKGALNKDSVALNGWEVATEENYFNIRTNYLDRKKDELKASKNFSHKTLEGMGMLKERTNATNAIILDDAFVALYKSMKSSAAYIGYAQPLRNAKMLLNDNSFQKSVIENYGQHYLDALKSYLVDIEGTISDVSSIEQLTLDVINKLDIAVLGANPFVMMKQPVSYSAAATEIDIKYLNNILPAKISEMSEHSPQLRERFKGNISRELGEVAQTGAVRNFWTHKSSLSQHIMAGIKANDYVAIGKIWTAVKRETKALHPKLEGDAKWEHIRKRAEKIIRRTQPTFDMKDRSAIGRSRKLFVRLLTKYSSQRNKNYMMTRRAIEKYNTSGKGVKDNISLLKNLVLLAIVMPAMIIGIDELRKKIYGWVTPERKRRYYTLRYIESLLGNVYFVGNVFSSIASKIERGVYAGFDISNVLVSSVEKGVNGIVEIYNTIDQLQSKERYKSGDKKGQLKWNYTLKKALDYNASFLTKFRGIPYDTLKKLGQAPFRKKAPQSGWAKTSSKSGWGK